MHSVVFLDRDGTINVDTGYVTSADRVELIAGAADAIAKLKSAGFKVVIVTNQSAVGRGMAKVEDVLATNAELQKQLLAANPFAAIDEILFSTAAPSDNDDTRKPGIGLLRNFAYSPYSSWVVGDKLSDIEFGQNAGLPDENCILVLTGEGQSYRDRLPAESKAVKSLLEAASVILKSK